MAPDCFARTTAVASFFGRQPCRIGDPCWVGMSAVSNTSLTPIGMPWSGPGRAPTRRACAGSRNAKARTSGSRAGDPGETGFRQIARCQATGLCLHDAGRKLSPATLRLKEILIGSLALVDRP